MGSTIWLPILLALDSFFYRYLRDAPVNEQGPRGGKKLCNLASIEGERKEGLFFQEKSAAFSPIQKTCSFPIVFIIASKHESGRASFFK